VSVGIYCLPQFLGSGNKICFIFLVEAICKGVSPFQFTLLTSIASFCRSNNRVGGDGQNKNGGNFYKGMKYVFYEAFSLFLFKAYVAKHIT
jgi:hypothetical protein